MPNYKIVFITALMRIRMIFFLPIIYIFHMLKVTAILFVMFRLQGDIASP